VLEIKCPEKNLGWRSCAGGFNLGVKGLIGHSRIVGPQYGNHFTSSFRHLCANWNPHNKMCLKTRPTWTSKNKIRSCKGSRPFFTLSTQKFPFKSWMNNWKTRKVISEKVKTVKTCPDNFSVVLQLQWLIHKTKIIKVNLKMHYCMLLEISSIGFEAFITYTLCRNNVIPNT
jgi:hypothetical protein